MSCLILALLFLYIVSPIDLIPEALLGPFGLIDDLLAGLMGFFILARGYFPEIFELPKKFLK